MAILKFGPTVVGARGTIAGTIFSANKSGPFARTWSRSSNPRTALQTAQRATWSTFASAWKDLAQAERDDWDDYADDAPQELTNSLGETYFASGFAWYVRINTHLTIAGAAARDDAPTLTRPTAPVIQNATLFITGAAGITKVRYAVGDPALTDLHGINARVVSSQGITHLPSRMPFIIIEVPNAVSRNVDCEAEIEALFGTIALGQRWLVSTYIQDAHGQRGPEATAVDDAQS